LHRIRSDDLPVEDRRTSTSSALSRGESSYRRAEYKRLRRCAPSRQRWLIFRAEINHR
jgi:hypothetical protein